ncbi:MAG: hypothetical protein QNL62_00265 [Gammaproteobacteria bacterium]|nr:hypothetical protein [Gammaproteobacteria bacterium]
MHHHGSGELFILPLYFTPCSRITTIAGDEPDVRRIESGDTCVLLPWAKLLFILDSGEKRLGYWIVNITLFLLLGMIFVFLAA